MPNPHKPARRTSILGQLAKLILISPLPLLAQCSMADPVHSSTSTHYSERTPADEIIYFVLPDRFENADTTNDTGGISGDKLDHGFDPSHKGFYHGGDLKGLTEKLDYIQDLGATAVWLTPIFKNKAVQGTPGQKSSGYHGYWITDFTQIDPHLGSREDFKTFVDSAHARNMKVYMDIITNHTADVIKYKECHDTETHPELSKSGECPYRSVGEYPYTTTGHISGESTNEGFLGEDSKHQNDANFEKLVDPNFAYTPFIPDAEKSVKIPSWLNDPIYYHNRGDTTFKGENSLYGDFAGLDDLFTEHPRVVDGFIEIYSQWIRDFHIDGFRIDTARHVNPEFWQKLIPELEKTAKEEGINNFHIFGEVYEFDAGQLAVFTHRDQLPTVLDFAFQQTASDFILKGSSGETLSRLFAADHLYGEKAQNGLYLPTFLGNHDMGRFAGMMQDNLPNITDKEALARLKLAHALMILSRGVPTIYYGDEQGFVSDEGDQGARENMFPSNVASYNDNDLIGTEDKTSGNNFNTSHPLFLAISELAEIRTQHFALRQGTQKTRLADVEDSVFVQSRYSADGKTEYVIAFNAENSPQTLSFAVDGNSTEWDSLIGSCPTNSQATGALSLDIPSLGYVVCKARNGTQ